MKRRNLNLIINKDGHGTTNYKIALPKIWGDQMELSDTNRNVIMSFDGEKIIIEKGEYKMYKVIEFYDVYKKDLLDKYGAKEYSYHQANCDTTTEKILEEFADEKDAIKYAEERYNKMTIKDRYNVSGNNIYLSRIDVLDYSDDEKIESICSFGLSLELYEVIASGQYDINLIQKLYDYLDFRIENVANDIEHDYLTRHESNGKEYYWYMDENKNALIDMEGNIITDEDEIQKIMKY